MTLIERDCRKTILAAYACWAVAQGIPRMLAFADMLLLASDLGL